MAERSASVEAKTGAFSRPHGPLLQRKCACGAHSHGHAECAGCARKHGSLQCKLAIGASNDSLEAEADRVADHVMVGSTAPGIGVIQPRIQRFSGGGGATGIPVPDSIDEVLSAPGEPMQVELRRDMESRFGHDFSAVRLHTGEAAARSARDVAASAYTARHHIVLGSKAPPLRTFSGRRLLAHELTHVVQQSNTAGLVQRDTGESKSGEAFKLDGRVENAVGLEVFGDTTWPFLKAVIEGFVGGLKADIQAGRATEAKDHLSGLFRPWNAAKFYGGYMVGLVLGLVSPITDLVKGLIGLVRFAIPALEWLGKWSLIGVAVSPDRQQKISTLIQKFGNLAGRFVDSIAELASNPKELIKKFAGFLDDMMRLALGKAHELGARAAHSIFDLMKLGYYDMGEAIGKVIGTLVAQVLMFVFSDAIANLVTEAAGMIGKAAKFVAGKAVELFEWIKGFASKAIAAIRGFAKSAGKLFGKLIDSVIDAFESFKALFSEAEALDTGAQKALVGVGDAASSSKLSNAMESRMVKSTRTSPAKISDLTPPKVHPSKAASAERRIDASKPINQVDPDSSSTAIGKRNGATGRGRDVRTQRPANGVNVAGEPRQVKTEFGDLSDPGYKGRLPDDPPRGHMLSKFEVSEENLKRMLNGKPPLGPDGKAVELHHRTRGPMSRLDEYTQTDHRNLGLHEPGVDSLIDREQFTKQRARYWISRARDLLGIGDI